MVEALASGKPVIALGRGGALEIVEDDCGMLYGAATDGSLDETLRHFDRVRGFFKPQRLQSRAALFSEAAFDLGFRAVLRRYGVSQKVEDQERNGRRGNSPAITYFTKYAGTARRAVS